MTIGMLGHGNVGGALARAFHGAGLDVRIGAREESLNNPPEWVRTLKIPITTVEDACDQAEVVVLAVPFGAVEDLLISISKSLAGKILIDCTNPVGAGLAHGLDNRTSGTEWIQSLLPSTSVAKCFTVYGYENFEKPPAGALQPSMFIAAGDDRAAQAASLLADRTGWSPLVVGGLDQALHMEHMTLLWVKMVRLRGQSPRTVWAMVQD